MAALKRSRACRPRQCRWRSFATCTSLAYSYDDDRAAFPRHRFWIVTAALLPRMLPNRNRASLPLKRACTRMHDRCLRRRTRLRRSRTLGAAA